MKNERNSGKKTFDGLTKDTTLLEDDMTNNDEN